MSEPAPPSPDVIAAAETLKRAVDAHLYAVAARRGEDDPAVQDAYDALRTAAEAYDEILFEVYDEVTPFDFSAGAESTADGDEEVEDLPLVPDTLSVLLRRDYDVVDPDMLVIAGRAARAEVDGAARLATADDDLPEGALDIADADDAQVGSAIYHLVHAYGVDGLHVRAEEIGLEPTGGTLWLLDELDGEIDDDPFGGIDEEKLRLRLDELYAVDPPL
jgi:hypothetical protein